MVAIVVSISLMPMVFLRLFSATSICAAPDLVDHVDRLVRQLAVMDVARGQLHRGFDRLVGVFSADGNPRNRVSGPEDGNGVLDRRLVDVDLGEPAHQRAILFEMLAIFLQVVEPMQRMVPDASAGFSKLEASIAPPEVAPAPITV